MLAKYWTLFKVLSLFSYISRDFHIIVNTYFSPKSYVNWLKLRCFPAFLYTKLQMLSEQFMRKFDFYVRGAVRPFSFHPAAAIWLAHFLQKLVKLMGNGQAVKTT